MSSCSFNGTENSSPVFYTANETAEDITNADIYSNEACGPYPLKPLFAKLDELLVYTSLAKTIGIIYNAPSSSLLVEMLEP